MIVKNSLTVAAVAGLLMWGSHSTAQVPHIIGTWALNAEASQVPGGIPDGVSDTRQYFLREDGYLVGIAVRVSPTGDVAFLQFTALSDGEEYPEYDTLTLADLQATGAQTPMTYSETVVDDYTVSIIDRRNGIVTATGTRSVSEDGRTMSVDLTVPGPDGEPVPLLLVYDRVAEGRNR